MKILLIDDDFKSRKTLLKEFSKFGRYNVAINNEEAVNELKKAWNKKSYDLVCLHISNPITDKHQILKEIRQTEQAHGKNCLDSVKIIITTAINDYNHIKTAFREQCDAYLIKPVNSEILFKELKNLKLIK